MPTVSVIIPTYNRADVLPRAVGSVLEQTHEDLELLIVDDGSTDATEACLEQFDDPRLTVIVHETNKGANAARNTGIDNASGEYVAFLDSDDEWKPTKLERQLDRIQSGEREWVGAYCDTDVVPGGTTGPVKKTAATLLKRLDDSHVHEGGDELASEILAGNIHTAAGSTLVVETAIAREVGGFDENLDWFHDPEFVLRVLDIGDVAYVDDPLVYRHGTGTWNPQRVYSASMEYRAKHADTVTRAETRGYDVEGTHELVIAKQFLSQGLIRRGLKHLGPASTEFRHVPGLLWATANGLRRNRSFGVAAVLCVAIAVVLLAVVLHR